MLRTIKHGIFRSALAVALVPTPLWGVQEQADKPKWVAPPSAPVPAPIITAKKAFISNAEETATSSPTITVAARIAPTTNFTGP